jgi:hypothetical protein
MEKKIHRTNSGGSVFGFNRKELEANRTILDVSI